ncbi:hypothetical protein DMUE_1948 [Dictyocoela muelleri]|nr:hypothetical protein DMUE_1948 [Dictyocoela muelleri]
MEFITRKNNLEIDFEFKDFSKNHISHSARFFILKEADFNLIFGNKFLVNIDAQINVSKKLLTVNGVNIKILDKNLDVWRESPNIEFTNKLNYYILFLFPKYG